jgi:hypothetical protein
MARKIVKPCAVNQQENSGRANVEPYKWKPGRPCPEKIWKEIERQLRSKKLKIRRLIESRSGLWAMKPADQGAMIYRRAIR